MADSFGPCMVGEPDDVLDPRAHVLGLLYEGLSQAARVRVAQWDGTARDRVRVWLLRIFVADGRAQLFCDQSWPGDSRSNSVYRSGNSQHAAGRTGCERIHSAAILRLARR